MSYQRCTHNLYYPVKIMNSAKRALSPPIEISKRPANFDTRPAQDPCETSSCSMPSCSTPSCSTPSCSTVINCQLREDELLLYSLMTLVFPNQTFLKNFAPNKYNEISRVIFEVTGVKYNNHSIRNYCHRVCSNTLKGFGKTNGVCNWNYYQANVISFTKHNKQFLEQALQGFELDDVTINSTLQQLTFHCTSQELSSNNMVNVKKKKFDINSINEDFELDILPSH